MFVKRKTKRPKPERRWASPALIGMSFRLGIPWRIALQQSPPPLSEPYPFSYPPFVPSELKSWNGNCPILAVSQIPAHRTALELLQALVLFDTPATQEYTWIAAESSSQG